MGRFASFLVALAIYCVTPWAGAAREPRPLGFSNLVLRLDEDRIGFATQDYRVHVLETLRAGNVNAVGAEDLVFDKDESARAELLLGGTARELECETKGVRVSCRLGIEWQLLDVATDQIVYQALIRTVALYVNTDNTKVIPYRLVKSQVNALLKRPRFREALAQAPAVPASPSYSAEEFRPCSAPATAMPSASEAVTRATVLVRTPNGFASGFFLGSDGLVLTAAHAVTTAGLKLETRDGTSMRAKPVRISKKHDSALLAVEGNRGPFPCLPLDTEPKAVGRDVYAIGAPAGRELAFSVTRGIISGVRDSDGTSLLQTDAPVNPGNSGGPLVDAQGRVVAIVSRKFTGQGIEGLGFCIPIEVALDALGLEPGDTTSGVLMRSMALNMSAKKTGSLFVDTSDPTPSLDPIGDEQRVARAREHHEEQTIRRLTPVYVPTLRWGGLLVASGGLVGAFVTSRQVADGGLTYEEYKSVRLANDLSWVAAGLGAVGFASSFFLTPDLPKQKAGSVAWDVKANTTGADLRVRF